MLKPTKRQTKRLIETDSLYKNGSFVRILRHLIAVLPATLKLKVLTECPVYHVRYHYNSVLLDGLVLDQI